MTRSLFPSCSPGVIWKVDGLGNFDIFSFVTAASAFLVRYAPVTQQERWEENAGYSPSTLAVRHLRPRLRRRHLPLPRLGRARHLPRGVRRLDRSPPRRSGPPPLAASSTPPSPTTTCASARPPPASPSTTLQIPEGMIHIANRSPDEQCEFRSPRQVIDPGFLELVRYGIRRADDPLIIDSLKVVDQILKIDTPYGPCWRRYNHDGYGQRKDGGPYMGWGQGRAWPILTGERGHFEFAAGNDPTPYIDAMEKFSSFGGMLPEQVWDYADMPSEGMYFGRSAGSAQPLVWAHAGIPEIAEIRRRRQNLRPHLRRRAALRRRERQTHLHQSPGNLPDRLAPSPPLCRAAPCASWTRPASASPTPPTTGPPRRRSKLASSAAPARSSTSPPPKARPPASSSRSTGRKTIAGSVTTAKSSSPSSPCP